MKYRRKPVVTEAFQWTGGPEQEDDLEWIIEAVRNGSTWFETREPRSEIHDSDSEGVHEASGGGITLSVV